jgi:tetratricopeptide (TPR) repeat protein
MARALRRPVLAGALLLVLGTLLLYIPAIRSGYIWDDDSYVHNNPTLDAPDALVRIWLDRTASPQYYPLVFTTFCIERALWGERPAGYHLVNALLHGLCAVLLWRLLRRLGVPGAFLAACVFAVHPVQVESVAWITERKNVLSGLCYLASASLFLRFLWPEAGHRSERRAGRRLLYAASLLLFVAALLAKTTASTLPAALLLVVAWKEKRLTRRHVMAALPFFAWGIALGLHTAWIETHQLGATGAAWSLRPLERLLVAGHALLFYLQKLLVPVQLTFIYPRWTLGSEAIRQLPYLVGVLALVAGLYAARRRIGMGPLVGFLFFAGTLFPALGFFNLYPFRYSYVADHFQYLAAIGPFAVLAAGMTRLHARWGPKRGASGAMTAGQPGNAGVVAAAALVAILAGLTYHQQKDYSDLETLWLRTLEKNPRAWIAQFNLGTTAVRRGQYEEGLRRLRTATELRPEEYNGWYSAGSVLNTLRRYEEALPYLQRATALYAGDADAQYALAFACMRTDRPRAALPPLAAALRLRPDWAEPMNALAWTLVAYPDSAFANPVEGVRLAERADSLAGSRDPYVLDTLAAAYAGAGRFGDALAALEKARALLAASGDREALEALEQKRELYASGRPYREASPAGP